MPLNDSDLLEKINNLDKRQFWYEECTTKKLRMLEESLNKCEIKFNSINDRLNKLEKHRRDKMPLKPGEKNIGKNIKELESTGRSKSQSIAIALKKAGKSMLQRYKRKTK